MAEDVSKKHKNKWQLLAAGSLGPALVQNAYKLFAGIGDDITDSPTTDIPKVISTWEDYYKFLVRKGGKVSPDTAAQSLESMIDTYLLLEAVRASLGINSY